MSDLLAAAAAALGTPEALVKRAAEARATATGSTVDEILAAWGGGGALPAAASDVRDESATPTPPSPAVPADGPPTSGGTQTVAPASPDVPALPAAPVGPYRPPVLVGAGDNPLTVLAGVVGLFLIVLLIGLVGPSIPTEVPGARSSDIAFSQDAADGQHVYMKMGCAACHTQMVRPVVADVGLGAVSLNDTNLVLGTRRFGPDLSNIASRSDAADIETVIRGGLGHPTHNLSSSDMSALNAYLSESSTTRDEPR